MLSSNTNFSFKIILTLKSFYQGSHLDSFRTCSKHNKISFHISFIYRIYNLASTKSRFKQDLLSNIIPLSSNIDFKSNCKNSLCATARIIKAYFELLNEFVQSM